jgi:hypothetical protein
MKITSYIKDFLPSLFGKAGLMEDLRFARSQFTQMQDTLSRVDKSLGTKFKSEQMKHVQQTFTGVAKVGNKSVFGFIAANTTNILETIDTLEAITAGEFEERVAAKGLNYRKANLVQLVDAVTFCANFTTKLMTYAMKAEIAASRDEKKMESIPTTDIVPFESDWIKKGLVAYSGAIAIIAKPAKEMLDRLDSIPDILADDVNYSNLKNTVGEAKLDPFMFGVSNFAWNPIRRIRMHAAEAKIARAKSAETELQMTKLRLLQFQRLSVKSLTCNLWLTNSPVSWLN